MTDSYGISLVASVFGQLPNLLFDVFQLVTMIEKHRPTNKWNAHFSGENRYDGPLRRAAVDDKQVLFPDNLQHRLDHPQVCRRLGTHMVVDPHHIRNAVNFFAYQFLDGVTWHIRGNCTRSQPVFFPVYGFHGYMQQYIKTRLMCPDCILARRSQKWHDSHRQRRLDGEHFIGSGQIVSHIVNDDGKTRRTLVVETMGSDFRSMHRLAVTRHFDHQADPCQQEYPFCARFHSPIPFQMAVHLEYAAGRKYIFKAATEVMDFYFLYIVLQK
jgi:hypothetical protein